MINDLRASWALLIGIGFMMLGNGLQGTLLGLRATMEGFPTFITGIMMSGYFVGIFAGSMIAPKLVQRVDGVNLHSGSWNLRRRYHLDRNAVYDWSQLRRVVCCCRKLA